jgi:hypothetical protein
MGLEEFFVLTVKCCHPRRNIKGEGIFLILTDTEVRKRGEQTGLGIQVVHAVNDDC